MGRASNKPTANSVQVDINIFINLGQTIKTGPELYVAKFAYGFFRASTLQITAAPADCRDLSKSGRSGKWMSIQDSIPYRIQ